MSTANAFPSYLLLFVVAAGVSACGRPAAYRISPLGSVPDWSRLEAFQETMTRGDFLYWLDQVFSPDGAYKNFLTVEADRVWIRTKTDGPNEGMSLRFAAEGKPAPIPPRYWRSRDTPAPPDAPAPSRKLPLRGRKIALDPGHLGGEWARMEERYFRYGSYPPVQEGDLTLQTARRLQAKLQALGAEVVLLRNSDQPLTKLRPADLRSLAASVVARAPASAAVSPEARVRAESERLFYRTAEIRERAKLVNETIRPDLVVALHFNAENWDDPDEPKLTEENHLHLIVHGAYLAEELADDNVRLEMLVKILNGSPREELALAESVGPALAAETGLQPCYYPAAAVKKIGLSPYVWARHLLANRLYEAPVLYLEPYVMNNRAVFSRIQAGDYEGRRLVDGTLQVSIFEEYAEGVSRGLVEFFNSKEGKNGHTNANSLR